MGKKLRLLVAAGGTGGHLFPAVAVVEELEEMLGADFEAAFIGREDKIEARFAGERGYKFYPIKTEGIRKLISMNTLTLPFRTFSAILHSRKIIKQGGYDCVLATGAYISYSPGMAASQLKTPLALMESNVNPGKSIKMLAPNADLFITSFAETANFFDRSVQKKIKCLGNPIRKYIFEAPSRGESRRRFGLEENLPTVLIFGGSLGARSINHAVEAALDQIAEENFQVLWQTGRNYELKRDLPSNVKMVEFINDMAAAYKACDLAVCRSGAATVSELASTGAPSLLVPLPSASNNEQEHNAKVFTGRGAAELIHDRDLDAELLPAMRDLINSPEKLEVMSRAALKLSKPHAARDAAKSILRLLGRDGY
ncbi:MAG: undecaprenyldiphospho-muramoylpentapeptide beta-N-acetylglucosaminyltransferase [Chloroflexota bacterium]